MKRSNAKGPKLVLGYARKLGRKPRTTASWMRDLRGADAPEAVKQGLRESAEGKTVYLGAFGGELPTPPKLPKGAKKLPRTLFKTANALRIMDAIKARGKKKPEELKRSDAEIARLTRTAAPDESAPLRPAPRLKNPHEKATDRKEDSRKR